MPRRSAAEIARLTSLFAGLALLVALSEPGPASIAAGLPLVAIGEAIRVWAAGHLVKTRILVTSGPYRHTRNPMYLGRLFVLAGLVTMAWLPGGATLVLLPVLLAGFFFYYLRRKERIEPARLRALHGNAYEAYRRAVPALFPRATPWSGGSDAAFSRERFHRSRESLTLAMIVALCAVLTVRAAAGS